MLIQILVLFFSLLLFYQFHLAHLREYFQDATQASETTTVVTNPTALQYQPYSTDDSGSAAFILAQQNAGNIEYLKQQVNTLLGLQKQVSDMNSNIQELNNQVVTLTQQQQQAATQLVGDQPLQVSIK